MAICGAAAAAVIAAAAGQVFTALLAWLVLGRRLSRGQTVAVQPLAPPARSMQNRFLHHRLLTRIADAAGTFENLESWQEGCWCTLAAEPGICRNTLQRSEAAAPGMQDRSPGQLTLGRELCRLPS